MTQQPDEDIISKDTSKTLQGIGGPMTRTRAKKTKEAFNQMVTTVIEAIPNLEEMEPKLINYTSLQGKDMGA